MTEGRTKSEIRNLALGVVAQIFNLLNCIAALGHALEIAAKFWPGGGSLVTVGRNSRPQYTLGNRRSDAFRPFGFRASDLSRISHSGAYTERSCSMSTLGNFRYVL